MRRETKMEGKPGRIPLAMDEPKHTLANGGHAGPTDTAAPPSQDSSASGPVDVGDLQDKIVAAMRTCYDPEIPVNIYELGLIYGVDIQESGDVTVRMTLTSPACPAAGSLPGEVQAKVGGIAGVKSAKVELVWDPPWNPDRMSEAARVQLGMF
jgi:FeS assembly SUF system protein